MIIGVKNINMDFNGLKVLKDFNLDFSSDSISCILGPSGCGKTTLLNIIAGTIKAKQGELIGFVEKVLSYIFQEPRLLPWLTVENNIEFPLLDIFPPKKRQIISKRFIRLMNLEGFETFYPHHLSGGMKQRVSIARAFAYPSEIILMDEPLKGLDFKLKLNLIQTFTKLWTADKRTVIFVTHDVDEALMLGSQIIVLSKAPAEIKTKLKIDIPYLKRNLNDKVFVEYKTTLLNALSS